MYIDHLFLHPKFDTTQHYLWSLHYIFRKLLGVKKDMVFKIKRVFQQRSLQKMFFLSSMSTEISSRSHSIPNFPVTYQTKQFQPSNLLVRFKIFGQLWGIHIVSVYLKSKGKFEICTYEAALWFSVVFKLQTT